MDLLTRWRRERPAEPGGITEADVRYAYRIILKRDPDPPGLAHYVALGRRGFPFDRLVSSLFESEEYRFRLAEAWRPTPVDLGGYQVCVQRRDRDFAEAMLDTREYEPHVRQAVSRLLAPGAVMVDVGANVGVMTFLAAAKVGAGGLVVAVEPNPDNVQMLYAGIVVNGCSNVHVLPWAASNRPAVLSLTGGVSNTWVTAARPPGEGFYTQAVRLDDVLQDLTRLDLLKIDIEGHEPEAFEGARGLVERFRPALVVEFNPRCLADIQGGDPAAFLGQLFASYPRLRAISGHGDDRTFERADDLLACWAARNQELTSRGVLADRHLHFDLVAEGGLQSKTPARS